jgi:hypothetical protein
MIKGVRLALTGMVLTIDEARGEVKFESNPPKMHYDVCPVWLSIAIEHLRIAKSANDFIGEKLEGEEKFQALEIEFRASMQAITASAIVIDAFYAMVKKNLSSDANPFDAKKRGASRPAQVSEAFKQAFQLKAKGFGTIRNAIEQIYKYRDRAVHPTSDFSDVTYHPEFKLGLEARQVTYRYINAFKIVQFTVAMISELATIGKAKNDSLWERELGAWFFIEGRYVGPVRE